MKYIIFIHLFFALKLSAQQVITELPKELAETSALITHNNEFYTINDSGNEAKIYVFSREGEILHTCSIKNGSNIDWEALCFDQEYIYIGDIGNNMNKRKELGIYRVSKEKVRTENTVQAEIVRFHYPDQTAFPPEKTKQYYDAESLVVKNDSLFIFTKNRTVPFDGVSKVYHIPFITAKEVKAVYLYKLELPATHWMEESITDAAFYDDRLFILTYAKVYEFEWNGAQFDKRQCYLFDQFTQKEGLAISENILFLTDERQAGGRGENHLYKMKR